MHIHFNHHISCIVDIIKLIREAHPDVTVSASHARSDHGLGDLLDHITTEMPAPADGSMPSEYTGWLIDEAVKQGADVVIPYRHRHALAACRDAFQQQGIKLLTCGSYDAISTIEDKTQLLSFAEKLGLTISPFKEWHDVDGFDASLQHFSGNGGNANRLCIKPAKGIYGEGFKILYDDREKNVLKVAINDQRPHISIQTLHGILEMHGPINKMMTMPFLPGTERSVDFACLDGTLLGAVTREKHGSVQVVGHNSVAVRMAEILVPAMGLSGLANLQTLEGPDGVQYLLEVNSRAAGGIGMTAISGINLPGLLVSALKGDIPDHPVFPDRQVSVGRRYIYEEI